MIVHEYSLPMHLTLQDICEKEQVRPVVSRDMKIGELGCSKHTASRNPQITAVHELRFEGTVS